MGRLPFNPDDMAAAKAGSASRRAATEAKQASSISVSALASLIDNALKERVPTGLRVLGEISGFSDRTHWYFTLKDEGAVISAVMFASSAAKCRFKPAAGQKVIASGRVEFFGKQGRTQFYVTAMEPVGAGELDARLRALIEEIRALGWLDPARKRTLPKFPRRVAVVSSKTGAALQDVLDTMRRRCPAVEVAVVDVRVQGDGAAGEIAGALGWVSAHHRRLGVDAVILTRGGGSIEDLGAFNEREVAEAVLKCAVPVVAAIGHETDTTVAELVADERAATPTQAAMRLTPDRAALLEQLGQLGSRASAFMLRTIRQDRRGLEAIARRPALADPAYLLAEPRDRLESGWRRLCGAGGASLARRRAELERLGARLARQEPRGLYASRRAALTHNAARLLRAVRARLATDAAGEAGARLRGAWSLAVERRAAALAALERELTIASPVSVLSRGYSMTTLASGELVRSVTQTSPGTRLTTRVADGSVESMVGGAPAREEAAFVAPALSPRRAARAIRRGRRTPRDQLDLF